MAEFEFFMGNWICHRLAFLICNQCDYPYELLRSTLILDLSETYRLTSEKAITDCIGYLIRNGLLRLESIEDNELKKCIEEVKNSGDKRIKDPKKYCLKQRKGKTINILHATSQLCTQFTVFLEHHPEIKIRKIPLFTDCHYKK